MVVSRSICKQILEASFGWGTRSDCSSGQLLHELAKSSSLKHFVCDKIVPLMWLHVIFFHVNLHIKLANVCHKHSIVTTMPYCEPTLKDSRFKLNLLSFIPLLFWLWHLFSLIHPQSYLLHILLFFFLKPWPRYCHPNSPGTEKCLSNTSWIIKMGHM